MSSQITPNSDLTDVTPELQSSRYISPSQLTDFERKSMETDFEKLKYYTDKTNEELKQEHELKQSENWIYLSLNDLVNNFVNVVLMMINDFIVLINNSKKMSFIEICKNVINILTENDRIVYTGIFMILLYIIYTL